MKLVSWKTTSILVINLWIQFHNPGLPLLAPFRSPVWALVAVAAIRLTQMTNNVAESE
jgi:hypothetical protein